MQDLLDEVLQLLLGRLLERRHGDSAEDHLQPRNSHRADGLARVRFVRREEGLLQARPSVGGDGALRRAEEIRQSRIRVRADEDGLPVEGRLLLQVGLLHAGEVGVLRHLRRPLVQLSEDRLQVLDILLQTDVRVRHDAELDAAQEVKRRRLPSLCLLLCEESEAKGRGHDDVAVVEVPIQGEARLRLGRRPADPPGLDLDADLEVVVRIHKVSQVLRPLGPFALRAGQGLSLLSLALAVAQVLGAEVQDQILVPRERQVLLISAEQANHRIDPPECHAARDLLSLLVSAILHPPALQLRVMPRDGPLGAHHEVEQMCCQHGHPQIWRQPKGNFFLVRGSLLCAAFAQESPGAPRPHRHVHIPPALQMAKQSSLHWQAVDDGRLHGFLARQ
eukprot:scaffold8568_cov248-Pinguiococcus_pyrenoidosus.AAC.2